MDDQTTIAPDKVKASDLDRVAMAPGALELAGTPEGYDALVTADVVRARGGVVLFCARDYAAAGAFAGALQFFAPELPVLNFPAWDCLPYDRMSPTPSLAAQRMATLAALARRDPDGRSPLLVTTTVGALVQRMPPRSETVAAGFATHVGRDLDTTALERYFTVNGYQRASTVSERGEYAIRGGVIDVFPPGAEEPVRFDMFGDSLEFDPRLRPGKPTLHPPAQRDRAVAGFRGVARQGGDLALPLGLSRGLWRAGR